MMRETKIGLLVGLAFIIVIGILLSDHLTSTTQPQQAALVTAGGNVRSAVTVPGETSVARLADAAQNTRQVVPQQPVPTREELTPRKPPVEIVQIGQAPQPKAIEQQKQPAEQNTQIASGSNGSAPTSLSAEQGMNGVDGNSFDIGRHASGPGSLASIAKGMGEEIVPADNSADSASPSKPADAGNASTAGERQYTAAPGDSLSKIASRFLGNGRKANCDAIIAANPTLQQNPNLIIAGQTYVIPASASSSAPSPRTRTASNNSSRADSNPPSSAQLPTKSPEYFYTVKPGDTLTRIALEELGNAQGVEAIKDLNQDQLGGSDLIRPNMKLRLPAKPVAIAQ